MREGRAARGALPSPKLKLGSVIVPPMASIKEDVMERCKDRRIVTIFGVKTPVQKRTRSKNWRVAAHGFLNSLEKDGIVKKTSRGIYELDPTMAEYQSKGRGSAGEKAICCALDSLGIKYEREKTFDDLKNVNHLRFDFYVEYNGQKIVIEFHGVQHFKPVEYFGGESAFVQRVKNDEKKKEYAIQNGYKYVVISNINEINVIIKEALEL